MALAWRIVQTHVADRAFSGEGARRYGGHWNSKGHAVVYTSSSISLAILEILVHIQIYDILEEYVYIPVEFDPKLSSINYPGQVRGFAAIGMLEYWNDG